MKCSKSAAIIFLLTACVGLSLSAQDSSLVPEPRGVLTSNSPEDKKTEESEREKEINTLNYGLDTEIIAMLDEFTANKTFYYLDELEVILERTRSVSLREKIITYFTDAEDGRLADYALEIIEDPFDTRNSTVALLFKYASKLKIEEAAPLAKKLLEED